MRRVLFIHFLVVGARGVAQQSDKVASSWLLRRTGRILSEDAGSLEDTTEITSELGEEILSVPAAAAPGEEDGEDGKENETPLGGSKIGDTQTLEFPVMNMTYQGNLDPSGAGMEGSEEVDLNALEGNGTKVAAGAPGGIDEVREKEMEALEGNGTGVIASGEIDEVREEEKDSPEGNETEVIGETPGGIDEVREEENEALKGNRTEAPGGIDVAEEIKDQTNSTSGSPDATSSPSPAPSKLATLETPNPAPPASTPKPTAPPTPNPTLPSTPNPTLRPTQKPVSVAQPIAAPTSPSEGNVEKPSWGDAFGSPNNDSNNNNNSGGIFAPSAQKETPASPSKDDATDPLKPSSPLEELEHEAEEIIEDPNVEIVSVVLIVVAVLTMVFVAQQMVENPDGICAKICRCTVATCRILSYPLRALCFCCSTARAKERRTHDLVPTDGFDEYDHELALS